MVITKAQLKKLQKDFNNKLGLIKKEMDKVILGFQKEIDVRKLTSLKNKINSP